MSNNNSQKYIYTKCNNPVVIFNKSAIYNICRVGGFMADGKFLSMSQVELDKLVNSEQLPSFLRHIKWSIHNNHDLILRYGAITPDGELIPIFYLVPCRHCPYCLSQRSREIQTRAMCENITSHTPPISVLLTYNDANLPCDGVSKKDIDLFLKRLRIALHRDGYTSPLRFLLVSEYGTKRGRAHYHCVFWNFPQFHTNKYLNYRAVKKYIEDYWQHGFASVRYTHDGQGSDTANATNYFVKYVYKGSHVPSGKNKCFVKCSRRPGLGAMWLALNEEFYLKNTSTRELIIKDKWSNIEFKSSLPKYFIDKLFPSISKLVPKEIRDCYKMLQRLQDVVSNKEYNELAEKYWFLPQYNCPLLSRQYMKSYPVKWFLPESNDLHRHYYFPTLIHLSAFILKILRNYEISDKVTDYLLQQKQDFAVDYFSNMPTLATELENMTRYEYFDFVNSRIKSLIPRQDDNQ